MPPDNCQGNLSPKPARPTRASDASTRSRYSVLRLAENSCLNGGTILSGSMMLSRIFSHGSRVGFWNAMPIRTWLAPTSRPATNTWPCEAVSVPATSLRMVDLPQPEGPTRATNSPWVIRNDVSASAVTLFLSPPNVTPTFSRSITLPAGIAGGAGEASIGLAFCRGGDGGHRRIGVARLSRRHLLEGMHRAAAAARVLLQDAILHHEASPHQRVNRQCGGLAALPG